MRSLSRLRQPVMVGPVRPAAGLYLRASPKDAGLCLDLRGKF